ncbi:glycosyltransferase family A protein [Pedobacter sp. Du54]|uniref:glycosyltransferase family 2 protein n=1 Tax=Pedobacter anseongensis TaxID=3133439 RepID=UPI0030A8D5DA
MVNPLVSVCIPVYNAEEYIGASIDCIVNQSYQNIEIIIVNDGSTDNTSAILKGFTDPRIIIINQTNKGQCAAANAALEASKGSYIKFFDADDILSDNFIENQVLRLNGRTNAIASASWGRFYDDDINTFSLNTEKIWKDMSPLEWIIGSINGSSMMQCGLWLIPRQILEKSGPWNEELTLINDFEFFIRVLLESEEILFTEDAILYYRSGISNSLSGTKSKAAYQSAYTSTELGVKHILKSENSSRTREVCANVFQLWSYEFYPSEIELYHQSRAWVKKLGGSKLKFPTGGKTKILVNILGWKLAKKLKLGFLDRSK